MKVINCDFKNNIGFNGYKPSKDEHGFKNVDFAFPYDPNTHKCYLEVFSLTKDKYNNFIIGNKCHTKDGRFSIELKPFNNKIDLAKTFGITDEMPFAYHYILENKYNNSIRPEIDPGLTIDIRPEDHNADDSRIYNIVPAGGTRMTDGGSMKLVILDSQNVGYIYDKNNKPVQDKKLTQRGYEGVKSITNKFGGNMAGFEHAVDSGSLDMYRRILCLPIFTDDDFSAHSYWNKNCNQIASSIGNINNYSNLQKKMFAHGLNFVSDGAFVNEGLQGTHFTHMLKWGIDSPYFRWFKANSLIDKPLSLGIFPKKTDFVSHKIINSPYTYKQNKNGHISIGINKKYDSNKPTKIQYFDKRLTTKEEQQDTQNAIKSYSKMNTNNIYDLTTHNDEIFPYSFEINVDEYNANIKRLNEYNSAHKDKPIMLDDFKAAKFLSEFENFSVDGKFESGFETWDDNPDIAKLNFVTSNSDLISLKNFDPIEKLREEKKLRIANAQVQDYAVESGKYWTKITNDILRLNIAQNLPNTQNYDKQNASFIFKRLKSKVDEGIFPKSVLDEVSEKEIKNVLSGRYLHYRELSNNDKNSQILENLMNTPLDSIEFGDNIISVLASPLISKRATNKDEIGVSRYDLFRQGDINLPNEYRKTYSAMNGLYQNELLSFTKNILNEIDEKQKNNAKLFNGDEVTTFGKYVLPILVPQILKYAMIKSLSPKTEMKFNDENGEISYDYKTLKELSLQGIGIKNPASVEDEALLMISKLQKGIENLSKKDNKDIKTAIYKQIKNTDEGSFALADLIIDKTQSGLDWRIDATKDIADVEALRNSHDSFYDTWQDVIDFWEKFTGEILKQNPNSYLTAEVTCAGDLYTKGQGYNYQKFSNNSDIMQKFFKETGITAEANYEQYFYNIAKIFAKNFDDGAPDGPKTADGVTEWIYNIMINRPDSFLKRASLPTINYTYSFIDNHDKPRAIHCTALDMGMFYADLNNPANKDFRKTAYTLLNDKFLEPVSDEEVQNYNFESVSPKAIAMGLAIRKACVNVLEEYKRNNRLSQEQFEKALIAVSQSVKDLSNGYFLGQHFEPDSFGVKPIDINVNSVIKQATDRYGLDLPKDLQAKYEDEVFEAILRPAVPKLLAMMKYLVALPGMPTLFDGDDLGASGWETETKNMDLAVRQKVHEEWADEKSGKYKKFIADYKKEFDKAMAVRRNPKCAALNNGAAYMLPVQNAKRDWEKNYRIPVPAILRQSTDGRMAISLLNPLSKNAYQQRFDFDHEVQYEPEKLTLDAIKLNFTTDNDDHNIINDGSLGRGVTGLKEGMVFQNANDENDTYEVNKVDGLYMLKHRTGDGRILLDDTTLNLFYVPDGTKLTFTGNYKPLNIPNLYNTKTSHIGKHLSIVSK